MSNNLNINGFTCTSNTIFAQLGSKGLSSKELERLDTNSDKRISEDEFVELLDSEELQQNEKYNNDETIQYYEKQYQEAQTIVDSLNGDIASYRNFQRELKRSMGGLDSESKASVQRQLDEVSNEIRQEYSRINDMVERGDCLYCDIVLSYMAKAVARVRARIARVCKKTVVKFV